MDICKERGRQKKRVIKNRAKNRDKRVGHCRRLKKVEKKKKHWIGVLPAEEFYF